MEFKYGGILEGDTTTYAGKTSAVVYVSGCPFRCGFCFSGPLILDAENAQAADVDNFLEYFELKKAELEAIVFTGGEPLQQAEAMMEICHRLRAMGFSVRLETAGFYSESLEKILPYVDNVAMDFKTGFHAEKYAQLTGFRGEPATLMQDTLRSVRILKKAKAERPELYVEFRTTVIPTVNDDPKTIAAIAAEVSFCDKYALQQFTASGTLIDPVYEKYGETPKLSLIELADVAAAHVKNVVIRTQQDGEQPFERLAEASAPL